jgi:pimeloyl-ACP methyl ester carboxylesterase
MSEPPTPESFIALLGGFPEKPPLETEVLETQQQDGYTRKLVEYTAAGDIRVQGFLLVPETRAGTLLPSALAIHQDRPDDRYDIGKSEPAGVSGDPDLHYGLELCLRGYVVLCPDRPGFESRRHAVGMFDQYYGDVPLRGLLYEMHRAVDCLASWAEADGLRIGTIGHSAGGWLAALLAYTDRRIRACATSNATWLWRWSTEPKPAALAGLNVPKPMIPGLEDWGDQDDALAGIAPRPYLEAGDPWPSGFDEELTRKARERYAELDVPERFEWLTYESRHTFPSEMRERSYAWLDRWLGRA